VQIKKKKKICTKFYQAIKAKRGLSSISHWKFCFGLERKIY